MEQNTQILHPSLRSLNRIYLILCHGNESTVATKEQNSGSRDETINSQIVYQVIKLTRGQRGSSAFCINFSTRGSLIQTKKLLVRAAYKYCTHTRTRHFLILYFPVESLATKSTFATLLLSSNSHFENESFGKVILQLVSAIPAFNRGRVNRERERVNRERVRRLIIG